MKRKAETLMETLAAMAVFVIIVVMILDCIANLIPHFARISDRRHMLYAAHQIMACSSVDIEVSTFTAIPDTGVEYTLHDKVLTLKKGNSTMTLNLDE